MSSFPLLITKQISAMPESRHSSTRCAMIGWLPIGRSSLGTVFVHGRKRVPSPATGRIAWVGLMARIINKEESPRTEKYVKCDRMPQRDGNFSIAVLRGPGADLLFSRKKVIISLEIKSKTSTLHTFPYPLFHGCTVRECRRSS